VAELMRLGGSRAKRGMGRGAARARDEVIE
jgi:hypothetical protein